MTATFPPPLGDPGDKSIEDNREIVGKIEKKGRNNVHTLGFSGVDKIRTGERGMDG